MTMRFFSSDNIFTRIMSRIWILFAANVLFLLCCLPIVTAGAGLAALYYTVLRSLYENGDIKPANTFLKGLKENFRQATVVWFVFLAMAVLIYLEIFWCRQFAGFVSMFRFGLYAIALVLAVLAVYVFPVISTFQCTLSQLLKNSIGFAFRKPAIIPALLFLNVVPMAWTFFTNAYMPLYAFLWCTVGFSGIAMLCARLLLPLFRPFLDTNDYFVSTPAQQSERQILQDMKKLDR